MFSINLTTESLEDLQGYRKFDQQRIMSGIESQLTHQPDLITRHRKKLRPNRLAEWELRIDDFRVFYDVSQAESSVKIVAIGRKEGEKLLVHGEEYEL